MNYSDIPVKPVYIAIAVLIFVLVMSFAGVKTYLRWTNVHYFGKIVEIKNENLLIETERGITNIVLVNKETRVLKGRKPNNENLRIGDFVIVVGTINQTGFIEGKMIRVVDPPNPRL